MVKICIMCGIPTTGSMDGPYICGRCDCGIRPDGSAFTGDDAVAYYKRVGDWYWAKQDGDADRKFDPIFKGRGTDDEEGECHGAEGEHPASL